MARDISNTEDILDSRDVIARIEELEGKLEIIKEGFPALLSEVEMDGADNDKYDAVDELKILYALADQCEGCPDWSYGETLIRDSYFEEYAEELASDIGAINRDARWPLTHINWKEAAEELQHDYMSVDYDGVEYWIRA